MFKFLSLNRWRWIQEGWSHENEIYERLEFKPKPLSLRKICFILSYVYMIYWNKLFQVFLFLNKNVMQGFWNYKLVQPTEYSLWDGRWSIWSQAKGQLCCMLCFYTILHHFKALRLSGKSFLLLPVISNSK